MNSYPGFEITIDETEYPKYHVDSPEETVKLTFKIIKENESEKRVTIVLWAACLWDYNTMEKLDSRLDLAWKDFYKGHLRDLVMRRILGAINEVLSICLYYWRGGGKVVVGVACSYLTGEDMVIITLNKNGVNVGGWLSSELRGLKGKTVKWHP